jgi:hypothetical protein
LLFFLFCCLFQLREALFSRGGHHRLISFVSSRANAPSSSLSDFASIASCCDVFRAMLMLDRERMSALVHSQLISLGSSLQTALLRARGLLLMRLSLFSFPISFFACLSVFCSCFEAILFYIKFSFFSFSNSFSVSPAAVEVNSGRPVIVTSACFIVSV